MAGHYFVELGVLSFVSEFRRDATTVRNQTSAVVYSYADSDFAAEVLDKLHSSGGRAFGVYAEALVAADSRTSKDIMTESALYTATDVISLNFTDLSPQIRSRCSLLFAGDAAEKSFDEYMSAAEPSVPAFREVIVTKQSNG